MDREKLKRLGELARKQSGPGLSPEETHEQATLRREYLDEIRANLRAQVESIRIEQKDGSYEKLRKKQRDPGA